MLISCFIRDLSVVICKLQIMVSAATSVDLFDRHLRFVAGDHVITTLEHELVLSR